MRKNILFNTTRQWNCGDQIIMLGILRLLRHVDFNTFIFNRHPNIWGRGVGNSYRPDAHSLKNIDYYIAAGTPEWADIKLTPLYAALIAQKIPSSFIGVGGDAQEELKSLDPLFQLLKRSELLIARDKAAYHTLAPLGGQLLPCPGFLCGELPGRPKTRLNTIGLIFMSYGTKANSIPQRLQTELIAGYKAVIAHYKTIIICHYIDEALEARDYFPNTPIFYSYDARDYEAFYSRCDLVIGPRLHGILLAAGLGIPCYITRDYDAANEQRRIGATEPLGIPSLIPSHPIAFTEAVDSMNIKKESERLVLLRYNTESEYLTVFSQHMRSLYKK